MSKIISPRKIFAATALATILSANHAGAVQTADPSFVLTMKPTHGISFDFGTKRAVSYFLSDNGRCKLVLTVAEAPNWDGVPSLTATRFEAAIPAGKATRFNPIEGAALKFACREGAQAMTVETVLQVAYSGGG